MEAIIICILFLMFTIGHASSPCSSGYISFSFSESRPQEGNQALWFLLDAETNKTIFKSSDVRDRGSRIDSLCIPQTKDLQYKISIPPETAVATGNSISIFGQHANRVLISPYVPSTKRFSLLDLIEPGSEWIHTCKHYEGWNTRDFLGKAEFVNPDSACSGSNHVEYYFKSFSGREHFAAYEIKFRYQAGIIAYLNGVEIYRDNLPDGELSSSTTSQRAYSSVSYRGTIRTGGEITCVNCFLAVAVYSEERALRKPVEDPSMTSFDAWLAVYHGSDSTSQAYIVPCLTTSLTRSSDYPSSPSFLVDYKLVPTPVFSSTSSIHLEVQTQHAQVTYWHVGSLLYNCDQLDERTSFSSQSRRDSLFDEMTVYHRLVINPTVIVEEHTMDCLAYIVNDLDISNPLHFKPASILSLPSSSSPVIIENGGEEEEEMKFSLISVILISVISVLVFIVLILIGVVIWICLKRREHPSLPIESLQSIKEHSSKEQTSEKSSARHGVPTKQQPQSQSQSHPHPHPQPQPQPQSQPHPQPQPQPQPQPHYHHHHHHHQERVTISTEASIDKRNQTSQLSMRYRVPEMEPIQSYDESSSEQYYDQPEIPSIPIHNHHHHQYQYQYQNHPNHPNHPSSSPYLEQPSMPQSDIPDPSSPQLRSTRYYSPSHQPDQPYNRPTRAQTVIAPPPPPPPPSLPPTSSRHYNPSNQPYDPPARAQSVISLLPSRLNNQHKPYSSQSVYMPHPDHSSYHPNPRSVISPPSQPHNPPSDSQSVIPRSIPPPPSSQPRYSSRSVLPPPPPNPPPSVNERTRVHPSIPSNPPTTQARTVLTLPRRNASTSMNVSDSKRYT